VTLELVNPRDKFKLKQGFVSNEVVLGHLEWVLKSFAAKPEYSRFYIGITNELERRLADHRGDATKKDFRLMCPIVEEESPQALGGAFDGLELAAIARFNPGVMNIETNKLLKCITASRVSRRNACSTSWLADATYGRAVSVFQSRARGGRLRYLHGTSENLYS
jgi:hypothetical protein